ncbi:MAG: hypothetical protein AAF903_00375 [Pseudomonadota bacterium]
MSDTSFNRPVSGLTSGSSSGGGQTVAYRALFSVLFIFSAFAAVANRLAGGKSSLSIWQAAKQAAHATAGYAVKY